MSARVGEGEPVAPGLYVVATPLGNLGDISPRAAAVLRQADVVYAEDTRRTRVLLSSLGLRKPLESLHGHNEPSRIPAALERLGKGERVALVSDAGTPAVSDPGAALVAAAHRAGHRVSPIPGPSALAAALSVAGFERGEPLFVGFLPSRGRERREALGRVLAHEGPVVLFEAPHRSERTLAELAEAAPAREVCWCRELTKVHEDVRRGTLAEAAAWAAAESRGELTLVLGPAATEAYEGAEASASDMDVDGALRRCLDAGLSPRDAATAVAAVLGRPRREVYQRCQALRDR